MTYSLRCKLCCYEILAALLLGLSVAPTPSLAQGSGAFLDFTAVSDIDLGVWSGAEVIAASTATGEREFCIIYRLQQTTGAEAIRVDYDLELTGPSANNEYVLQSSGGNLPVSFQIKRAAGNVESDLIPGARYDVTFDNPAVTTANLLSSDFIAPNGCNDARFDFEVLVDVADIIALSNPTGTFESDFTIRVDTPPYPDDFLAALGGAGATNVIDFTVSITIDSGVYIDQLSNAIDLNIGRTREEFCIWSLDGADIDLTATSDNPGSFTLINEDSSGVLVDSIPYTLRIRNINDGSNSRRLRNGVTRTGLGTESAASGGAFCNGPQGLNYRLNFRVRNRDVVGKPAGDYTDRITLTVSPN
jgi:hypothetical protein